jgi:3-dehydroquinate synthetase
MRCGIAEIIKHGVIGDPDLFAELETGNTELPLRWGQGRGAEWIARALRVKIRIVEEDPYERGRRAVLNLGHTVGHGLERLSDFSMRHGEAISIGMVAAARIAAELDQAASMLADRIESILTAWGLPVRCPPIKADAIWTAMTHDKKKRGDALRWILPKAIGVVEIVEDVPEVTIKSILRTIGAR